MLRADRTCVRYSIQQVKLFNGDGIDLIQSVDDWNIASALGLKDVNHIINCCVAADSDVGAVDAVLVHDRFDFLLPVSGKDQLGETSSTYIMINVCQRHSVRDTDPAFVFLLEDDIGRSLVDADSKSLEFVFDDPLVY